MNILLIEFVDCDVDPEEVEGKWEIKQDCLIYYDPDEKIGQVIIPLHNIFRMTEYRS